MRKKAFQTYRTSEAWPAVQASQSCGERRKRSVLREKIEDVAPKLLTGRAPTSIEETVGFAPIDLIVDRCKARLQMLGTQTRRLGELILRTDPDESGRKFLEF